MRGENYVPGASQFAIENHRKSASHGKVKTQRTDASHLYNEIR